jgi:DNA-binding PadR family transcriptional regulator
MLRHSGGWMALVDDRILEYLSENEAASPTEMMNGGPIKFSRAYIGRRCKKLKKEGLVREISDATYVITDDGEAYLEGRLDTENWRYIDEDTDEVAGDDNTNTAPSEGSHGDTS